MYRETNGWRRGGRFWPGKKEATRQRDLLNAQRLALPWVKVDKTCLFYAPAGRKSLGDLFEGGGIKNRVRRHDEYEDAPKAKPCCH